MSLRSISHRSEHSEQCAVVDWARHMNGQYPELSLLFAVPNGAVVPNFALVQKLKSEGLRPGVPDLCLPVVRGEWHGLFIEMKKAGGITSKEQREFIRGVLEQGYEAVICHSADEAIETLERYLNA